jgi:hypothetical protein
MKAVLLAALLLTPIDQQSQAQERKQDDGQPCELVDGGSHVLTSQMKATLATRYRSYLVHQQCVGENRVIDLDPAWSSVASGDYDADGKVDQAVLLETKAMPGRTIVVVFMSSLGGSALLAGEGSSYISTINRGGLGHNWDTEQDFTYTTDAIFSGDFHCCGVSFVWRNGKFYRFTSSD